jgi:hypothetical protein
MPLTCEHVSQCTRQVLPFPSDPSWFVVVSLVHPSYAIEARVENKSVFRVRV